MSPVASFDPEEPGFDLIHKVSPGLYTYVTHFKFDNKVPLQNRSVIIHSPRKSRSGELIIINPSELKPSILQGLKDLEEKLDAKVTRLLSTGDWHYLFIAEYLKQFPNSTAYVPPGRIPGKSPAFPFSLIDVASSEPLAPLAPDLQTINVNGLQDFTSPTPGVARYELVYFHRASRTIVAGDVFWYIRGELEPHHKHMGLRPGVLDFHFAKWQMVLDAAQLRQSLRKILSWDFAHFISIHGGPGNMLVNDAHEQVARILTWAETVREPGA